VKRRVVLISLIGLLLAACHQQRPSTPLPTAVPPAPDRSPDIWAVPFRYEFPAELLGVGEHRYAFLIRCPVIESKDIATEWRHFRVSDQILPQSEPVYLRMEGLSSDPFTPSYITNRVIHPERPVIAVVHLVGLSRSAAEIAAADCQVLVFWDAVGRQLLAPQEPVLP
jgi:hypothetical protein